MNALNAGTLSCFTIVIWAVMGSNTVIAQDRKSDFEVGPQVLILASQGEPSNDMAGVGVVVSWPWKDDWYFGASIDDVSFDYERPQRELGIPQPAGTKAIDGSNSFTRLAGWIERRYTSNSNWDWFWGAGLGYATVDADTVTGPTALLGTFNIVTDASDEVHLMLRTGLRRSLGNRWMFTGAFHLEHHLTDYKIRDTVSDASGKIGAHTPVGLSATFSYRF